MAFCVIDSDMWLYGYVYKKSNINYVIDYNLKTQQQIGFNLNILS